MSHNNNTSSSPQQYELKLGVIHHPSLKTIQLIEFLQNQSNEFLSNDLPQYVKGDQKFVNIMETIHFQNTQQISSYEFDEYVGLLLIYSTSSDESFQYTTQIIQQILSAQMGDVFMIVVEMDNSQKSANLIGNAGQRFCQKNGIQFVRLTLYNSEDLISMINKSLYQLIENYYYPNEEINVEEEGKDGEGDGVGELKLGTMNNRQYDQQQRSNPLSERKSQQHNSTERSNQGQYIFSYDQQYHTINAYNQSYSPKVQNTEEMISHAASLRKSREKQNSLHQQNLDQSIQNIENVLNNINHRIKEKLNSGWFTEIKEKLYSTAEKDNANFSKNQPLKKSKKVFNPSVMQSRYSDLLNNSSKSFALNFNTLKFNISSIKTPILRLVLFLSKVLDHQFSKEKVVELEVYENSTYDELALIAIRRLQLNETDKNIQKMISKIKKSIEGFSKELHRAIKLFEQKKIHQRSFIKSKTLTYQ